MSSELPKQEVDSWIAANALSHRLSVSSVSLGLSHLAHCLIDPSVRWLSVFYLHVYITVLGSKLVKLHFPVAVG